MAQKYGMSDDGFIGRSPTARKPQAFEVGMAVCVVSMAVCTWCSVDLRNRGGNLWTLADLAPFIRII